MEKNEDGSFNIYICPECKEEYYEFEEMVECWKSDKQYKEK